MGRSRHGMCWTVPLKATCSSMQCQESCRRNYSDACVRSLGMIGRADLALARLFSSLCSLCMCGVVAVGVFGGSGCWSFRYLVRLGHPWAFITCKCLFSIFRCVWGASVPHTRSNAQHISV